MKRHLNGACQIRVLLGSIVILLLLVTLFFPAPVDAAPCDYIVQPGDTLSSIATRHDSTLNALLAANPHITNPNLIHAGQRLTLPACGDASVPDVEEIFQPPPPQEVPDPPPDLDQALWDGVHDATIMIRYPIKGPVAGGSGIVVGRDGRTFLTAFHVIANPLTGEQVKEVAVGPFAGFQFTAELVAADPSLDLALFRVREPEFPGFAVAPMGDSSTLGSDSAIYTLSYPKMEGALISGKGHYLTEVLSFHHRSPLILTDAHANFGSSGGVAVDSQGRVIGIITGGIISREEAAKLGYPELDWATLLVPINAAGDLLREAGLP